MEHPLIGDISNLSLDELGGKVSELQKRLSIAQRTGNAWLTTQVKMALETYNNCYQQKLRESWSKTQGPNLDSLINIE